MVESCQFSTSSCSSCSLAALAHVDRNHAGCESVNVKIEPSSVNEKFSNFRRRKNQGSNLLLTHFPAHLVSGESIKG